MNIFKKKIKQYNYLAKIDSLKYYEILKKHFLLLDSTKNVNQEIEYIGMDPYDSDNFDPDDEQYMDEIMISITSELNLNEILNEIHKCKNKYNLHLKSTYDTLNLSEKYTGESRYKTPDIFTKDGILIVIVIFFVVVILMAKFQSSLNEESNNNISSKLINAFESNKPIFCMTQTFNSKSLDTKEKRSVIQKNTNWKYNKKYFYNDKIFFEFRNCHL